MSDDRDREADRPSESVWDYPRPPRIAPDPRRVRVIFAGVTIVDTTRALRVLETSHPPTWYLPASDLRRDCVLPNRRSSSCEFKGKASYFDLLVEGRRVESAGWFYASPRPDFAALADHYAFYARCVDEVWVGDERVVPQAGDFYGGWVTRELVGPFKGGPGTSGW